MIIFFCLKIIRLRCSSRSDYPGLRCFLKVHFYANIRGTLVTVAVEMTEIFVSMRRAQVIAMDAKMRQFHPKVLTNDID